MVLIGRNKHEARTATVVVVVVVVVVGIWKLEFGTWTFQPASGDKGAKHLAYCGSS